MDISHCAIMDDCLCDRMDLGHDLDVMAASDGGQGHSQGHTAGGHRAGKGYSQGHDQGHRAGGHRAGQGHTDGVMDLMDGLVSGLLSAGLHSDPLRGLTRPYTALQGPIGP